MTTENSSKCDCNDRGFTTSKGTSGAVYGLGFIGAAIYFIGHAVGFWAGVLGFLKAIIWPVFIVMKALEALYS